MWAEEIAAKWLISHGYEILRQRWRSGYGEIDIIASKSGACAFVEVKCRENFSSAVYSVSDKQKQRLINAAEMFVANRASITQQDLHEFRFDVITVNHSGDIVHLQNCITT